MSEITLEKLDGGEDVLLHVTMDRGFAQTCVIDGKLLDEVRNRVSPGERKGNVSAQHGMDDCNQAILAAASEAMRHHPSAQGPLRLESKHFPFVDGNQAPAL